MLNEDCENQNCRNLIEEYRKEISSLKNRAVLSEQKCQSLMGEKELMKKKSHEFINELYSKTLSDC